MDHHRRARLHAAMADPTRVAIVDALAESDLTPGDLADLVDVTPSLLSFHLDVLAAAGLLRRSVSSGDRRRRYVTLTDRPLRDLTPRTRLPDGPVVFVCTKNSARSPLAAALWRRELRRPASSAGTRPGDHYHPKAIAAARRFGLDLGDDRPRRLGDVMSDRATPGHLVVTVCDQAREELGPVGWHWSTADPVEDGSDAAFSRAVIALRERIGRLPDPTTHPSRELPPHGGTGRKADDT